MYQYTNSCDTKTIVCCATALSVALPPFMIMGGDRLLARLGFALCIPTLVCDIMHFYGVQDFVYFMVT